MKTLSRHLIAELYACSGPIDVVDEVARCLREAAEAIGATVVGEAFHRYAPQGVSGILLIAESHISVHTWPEAGYVALDIFTCGGIDPRPAVALIAERLGAAEQQTHEIVRGLPGDVEPGRTLLPADVSLLTDLVAGR